ncbi:4'-phosphopantetheinyl transferase family protein [Streptomyces sp. NPDC090029]|uniref:4'-phosphopantetheinyl transferase family protein n=1 Tax=Streptomyces sp. NPDC090029 TaxID=3365924 RepID=UPI003821130C
MSARAAAGARPSADGEVKLWVCANDDLGPGTATTLAGHWLDEHEQVTADRFIFERDRRQYLVAHVLMRRLLSLETGVPEALIELRRSDRGRPSVRPPEGGWPAAQGTLDFNLSHARGYNAIAVGRGRRVGVDVERLDRVSSRALDGIAESFTPGERVQLARMPTEIYDRAVLRLWTLKEAYAKARGLGLGLPFDSFGFVLSDNGGVAAFEPPADDPSGTWWLLELEPEPEVLVSLAVEDGATPMTALRLHTGFPWRPSALRASIHPGNPVPLLAPGTLSAALPLAGAAPRRAHPTELQRSVA